MTHADQHHSSETVLAADARFTGTLTTSGTALIRGGFEGEISGNGEITIAGEATCRGQIHAATIEIEGVFEGDVQATDHVRLAATANVTGDITAQAVTIAPGATFRGTVRVDPAPTTVIEAKGRPAAAAESKPRPHDTVFASADSDTAQPRTNGPANGPANGSINGSTWTTTRQPTLGAGLSSLGAATAAFPNQR